MSNTYSMQSAVLACQGILGLTVCACLCSVTANVALVHFILEHPTCGSVVGVGRQAFDCTVGRVVSCVIE